MNFEEILTELILNEYTNLLQDEKYYYLYKHFAIDPSLHTLGIFDNNTFLFSSPHTFNDPYDCNAILKYDFSKASKAIAEKILGERITNKVFNERKNHYIKRMENHQEILDWGNKSRKNFHITCLNNNPLNILMWSHYADHHKGFMIELKFDKETIFNSLYDCPLPVQYDDSYPILNFPFNFTPEDCVNDNNYACEIIIKRLLNKAKVWSYEKEFRLKASKNAENDSTRVFQEYKPEIMSTVILGSQIREDHRKAINKAVNNFNEKHFSNVQVYQSELNKTEYRLMVPYHPRL